MVTIILDSIISVKFFNFSAYTDELAQLKSSSSGTMSTTTTSTTAATTSTTTSTTSTTPTTPTISISLPSEIPAPATSALTSYKSAANEDVNATDQNSRKQSTDYELNNDYLEVSY